jgi:ParB family transcriptional regulator, chromosome partitioning protein
MTTSAAETTVGRVADKEKVEKRRALGRGLESLLPGPRVVGGTAARPVVPPSAGDAGSRAGVAAPHSPSSHSPAVHLPAPSAGEPFDGTIRAVVDEAVADAARAGGPAPHESSDETITIYAQAESRTPANLVVNLTIADIDKNPFQTRYVQDDDALEELSDSIKANGVVQPIMVRPSEEEGRYILILGERRLLASKKAGKTQIPALVRRVSLQQAAEMTIVENLQREDLSALEQAEAFRVLSKEFSLTQQQIGERVGLSRTSVTNYMRLLKLPRDVMQLLAEKKISFAEAKELLALSSDDQISKAALYAVKKGLTLEQIERLVLSMNGDLDPFPGMPGEVVKKSGARWVDPNVRAAQMELERMLGVRVRIRDRKGKGKIVIEYSTVDDYDRVVEMLRGKK